MTKAEELIENYIREGILPRELDDLFNSYGGGKAQKKAGGYQLTFKDATSAKDFVKDLQDEYSDYREYFKVKSTTGKTVVVVEK